MQKNPSLSIIIPAFNEEKTLALVVKEISGLASELLPDYEILIIDDASRDKTPQIADELARADSRVVVYHNERNMNLGYNFQKGIACASKNYICLIPADDDIIHESLRTIIGSTGRADLVLAYHANYEARHPLRRLVSKMFIRLVNFLFGFNVRYYNGPAVFSLEALRTVATTTFGFAYMAEIVVTLLTRGYSYKEVPMVLRPESKGINLRVFRPRNVISVLKTLFSLWWRIRIRGNLQ